jgi:hypothetical protein
MEPDRIVIRRAKAAWGRIVVAPAARLVSYVGSEASLSEPRNAVARFIWFWLVELYLSARMIHVVRG